LKKSKERRRLDSEKEEKICFVIAPIGEPDTEIRDRSDKIFEYLIIPSVKKFGYKPIRADHISEPGMITRQIIDLILESPLVIADLTGHNPNVFYELAIRHATKKPLIQIMDKGEKIPFDVVGFRTIPLDIHDIALIAKSKEQLEDQIKSIESGISEVETPISGALDLKTLKGSENPEKRQIADLIESISVFKSSLSFIETKLQDPKSLLPPQYLNLIFRNVYQQYLKVPELILELNEIINKLIKRLEEEELNLNEIEEFKEKLLMLSHRLANLDSRKYF